MPDTTPAPSRLALGGRGPFVGREREVAALEAMLQQTASQGSGRVALVAGEPGIGKTRLLTEVAEQAAARGWLVLFGRAYESEGMPPTSPSPRHSSRTCVAFVTSAWLSSWATGLWSWP